MTKQQAQAILFGAALGDALSHPAQALTLVQIKAQYGGTGIQALPDPAVCTAAMHTSLALTADLLDAGLNARVTPRSADATPTAYTAAIGYLYQHDERKLYEVAQAATPHTQSESAAEVAASIAGAYLVSLVLNGAHDHDYLRKVMTFCDGLSDVFDAAILRVGHVLGWTNEEAALTHIGGGRTGAEVIALALYCVLRYPDDYAACVRRAANTNGDSAAIASTAGAIMGARLGFDLLPSDWINRCEDGDYLHALSERMTRERGKSV